MSCGLIGHDSKGRNQGQARASLLCSLSLILSWVSRNSRWKRWIRLPETTHRRCAARARSCGEIAYTSADFFGESRMDSGAVSAADRPLYELVTGAAAETIADVVARMQGIDALLPVNDGLKWFNQLYLMVTQQVDLQPPGGAWQSPTWLTRLDVVFAGLYFDAVAGFLAGGEVPSAWSALFEARYRADV